MIEIVIPSQHSVRADLLNQAYSLRYDFFVKERGWQIPGIPDGLDKDDYDTDNTVHFIEHDRQNGVVACARLNPTDRPHMFSEVFSDYCDLQGVIWGSDVYEASRYALNRKKLRPRELLAVKGRIEWAITWYCLQHDIKRLTWFMSQDVYMRNAQLWRTRPLGIPTYFSDDDTKYIPAVSDIDDAALMKVTTRYKFSSSDRICSLNDGNSTQYGIPQPVEETPIERPAAYGLERFTDATNQQVRQTG